MDCVGSLLCDREELVTSWVSGCQQRAIPVSAEVTLRGTLASPVEVREWVLAGLPTDGVSVDNGILVTRGKRWPLMIDPQVRMMYANGFDLWSTVLQAFSCAARLWEQASIDYLSSQSPCQHRSLCKTCLSGGVGYRLGVLSL